ncbi:glycoside hydrolase family 2 protein [Paenibacillus paeoniae]|uniref:Beta-glucuronidase n=1 Tax=Paenibacillus paeoniae TaxID=2292705 RepID=A0A371PE52_9BACL|nr:glycoside hydrolase family 2 TIM barrel-domain containing protein [Paenibacillus paeoniae]REK74179.1 glycoside hydrolase family 2 [Paenibacillus paeoniae]
MKQEAHNFVEQLHNQSYEDQYLKKLITHHSMISDRGRQKESLNGAWNFGVDQYDTCLRAKWYEENYVDADGLSNPMDFEFDRWETMKVPASWNTQQEKLFYYEGSGLYTRKFSYVNHGEERVFIKFGAVNYNAKIFLNRQYLGCHKGGSTPFFIEVTGFLEPENRLLVIANNTRKPSNVPTENTDWFNYGGIYRDVEILRLPATFIKDFVVGLVPDGSYSQIKLDLSVEGIERDGEGEISIPELGIKLPITAIGGSASLVFAAKPELWSPDNPKLYEVKVSYGKDTLQDKIGFREIRVEGTDIYLNGSKIYLKGISAHEESVPNGKAITEAEIMENFRLAKEMNCNYMRLAHYPHTEKAAQLADEMGIMLWEEIPVYWAIEFNNEGTYQDAENQLAELIIRDRNRASVIIWSVGNENADTDARLKFMSSLALKAKELDPTRLVSAACILDHVNHVIDDRLAVYLDVIGANQYYGWYQTDFNHLITLFENSRPDKPVIITEFGADAKAGHRGTSDEKGTEDCQLDIYRKQVAVLGQIPYVKGTSPWILYDFRCPRRLHPVTQNYYNTKGLLSEDKSYKKPAFYVMQEFYKHK